MNGRFRNAQTSWSRIAAIALTKFYRLGLCAFCSEKFHLFLQQKDLEEAIQPFFELALLKDRLEQAEASLKMSDSERRLHLSRLKLVVSEASGIVEQLSKFYE